MCFGLFCKGVHHQEPANITLKIQNCLLFIENLLKK